MESPASSELTFFTAGHGYHHFVIDQNTFDRSLYYNLLLQPGLAWSDQFLFQGTYLKAHLDRHPVPGDSWIEASLALGISKPFYRVDERDIRKVYRHLRDSRIGGLHPEADQIADRLAHTTICPGFWPHFSVGEAFETLAKRYFRRELPPRLDLNDPLCPDDLDQFWKRSRQDNWTLRDLDQATESTAAKRGSGMQLTEVANATARRLLGGRARPVSNTAELLLALKGAGHKTDVLTDVEMFYRILCELYARNLADAFAVSGNTPGWGGYVAALDYWNQNISPSAHLDSSHHIDAAQSDSVIRLPTLQTLRHVPGSCLRSIRGSPEADNYFNCLRVWQNTATSGCRATLLSALQRYSELICSVVGQQAQLAAYRAVFFDRVANVLGLLATIACVITARLNLPAGIGMALVAEWTLRTKQGRSSRVGKIKLSADSRPPRAVRLSRDVTLSRHTAD